MKSLLFDLASGLVFMAIFLVTKNIYLATGAGMAFGIGQAGWRLFRRQPIDLIQWATLVLVVVPGGATILLHNELFVKLKPTIAMAVIGCATLQPGWMRRYMPASRLHLFTPQLIARTGYVYSGVFFALSAANLAVALTTDTKTWAIYSGVSPWVVFPLMGGGIYLVFRRIALRQINDGMPASLAPTEAAS